MQALHAVSQLPLGGARHEVMVVLASEQPEVWYGSRAVAIFFYRGGKSFSKMFVTARTLRCQALAFDRFESGPVPRTVPVASQSVSRHLSCGPPRALHSAHCPVSRIEGRPCGLSYLCTVARFAL